jgi:hypothetical protein
MLTPMVATGREVDSPTFSSRVNIELGFNNAYSYMTLLIGKLKVAVCVFPLEVFTAVIDLKLNAGFPWQKLRSTRRRLSLPANWT